MIKLFSIRTLHGGINLVFIPYNHVATHIAYSFVPFFHFIFLFPACADPWSLLPG